jgi:SHS2 domain-containing protein
MAILSEATRVRSWSRARLESTDNVATQPPFEILEHTADAGIVAHGRTLAEAFANAAQGMYALIVNLEGVRAAESRDLAVSAGDLPNLLTHWLLELLFLTETEGMLFCRFDVNIRGTDLQARAHGEHLDPTRHELGGDIKGVTRHLLAIEPEDSGHRVRVLFDM